jgi:hypothetical protein
MLKWKGTIDGREIFMIGLSFGNLDRLRADEPILIKGRDVGFSYDILICAEATDQELLRKFSAGIGPDTKVNIDPGFRE